MRLPLLIPLLLAGCLHAQQSSAAGVAVDQNGKPLAGVHVRLITGEFDSGNGIDAVYGARSDESGHFALDGIKSGLYFVMAELAGFVQKSSGPLAILALKPGQQLTDYKITMTAQGVIEGHVSDEYGDPVQGVSVQTEAADSKQQQDFMFGGRNVTTDDRGEFRLIASPGKYYVKAGQFDRRGGQSEIRTDGTTGGPYIATYFPSSTTTDAASAVQLTPGQNLAGVEIRMLHAGSSPAAHTLTVTGSVSGIPDNGMAMVMLHCGETPEQLNESRGGQTKPDGTFVVSGVHAGFCKASATSVSGKSPLQSRAVDLRLEADQTGLQLTLAPAEELIGKLELAGDTAAGGAEKRTVRLEAASWNGGFGQAQPAAAEVAADGSFHISSVPPAKFKPIVEPMPENGYLKEVTLDGKAVPDRVLDFSQGVGGSRVKLTVSRNGGQISGRILGKDGEPAIGMIMVLMGTDVKHLDEENGARTTQGKYSFKALRPGKYRILALDVVELMQAFSGGGNEGETMQKLFEAAEEVEIKEGDRISKDLTPLTKVPEKKEDP